MVDGGKSGKLYVSHRLSSSLGSTKDPALDRAKIAQGES